MKKKALCNPLDLVNPLQPTTHGILLWTLNFGVVSPAAIAQQSPVADKGEMTGGGNGTGNTSPPPPYESIANVQVRVFRNVAPFWGAGMLHGA